MQKYIFYLLVVFISILNSCEYDFSEDSYKNIEQLPPTAVLELSEFENNITLKKPTNITYNYDGDNKHRLFEIIVYLNGEKIQNDFSESGLIYIDVDNLEEGEHQLKMEYYFSSGTGSLADLYDQEAYVSTQNYIFYVDKSIGEAPNLKSVENIDGTLFIKWDLLTHSNYDEAYLIIEGEEGNQINEIQLPEEVLKSGIYNDNLSFNNELVYSMKLINRYNSSLSNKISISIPEVVIELSILSETQQHSIKWEEHPLYANFDYYKYTNYGLVNEILDSKGGELIFDIDFALKENIFHYLKLYRDGQSIKTITKSINFGKPFELEYFKEIVYSPSRDNYFVIETIGESFFGSTQQLFLHRLNSNNLDIIETILVSDIIASTYVDLTLEPISQNLILDTQETSYLLDSTDLSIIQSWQISDYNFDAFRPRPHYRNGYVTIVDTLYEGIISIYNAETKALIYSAEKNYYFNISDDGKYFYNQDSIYEINNNEVNFITSTDTGGSVHTIEFLHDLNKCIYSNINSNPVIFDFNNRSKTIIDQITAVSDLQYDLSTNKVLFSQLHTGIYGGHKSFSNIYDFDNESIKQLEVYDSHYGHIYRFYNNTLIFSGGLYLDEYFN